MQFYAHLHMYVCAHCFVIICSSLALLVWWLHHRYQRLSCCCFIYCSTVAIRQLPEIYIYSIDNTDTYMIQFIFLELLLLLQEKPITSLLLYNDLVVYPVMTSDFFNYHRHIAYHCSRFSSMFIYIHTSICTYAYIKRSDSYFDLSLI